MCICDKGTPFSRIVVASNVWAIITETVRNPIFVESHQMLLINQRCRPSNKCQMCIFFPRCLWMLTDGTIGIDQHSHTHTLSLSVSLLPCFLSPPFSTLYKLALRLCVDQLKYRFHRIWLFSFPRVTQNWCHRLGWKVFVKTENKKRKSKNVSQKFLSKLWHFLL